MRPRCIRFHRLASGNDRWPAHGKEHTGGCSLISGRLPPPRPVVQVPIENVLVGLSDLFVETVATIPRVHRSVLPVVLKISLEADQTAWNAKVAQEKTNRGLRSPSFVPLRGYCDWCSAGSARTCISRRSHRPSFSARSRRRSANRRSLSPADCRRASRTHHHAMNPRHASHRRTSRGGAARSLSSARATRFFRGTLAPRPTTLQFFGRGSAAIFERQLRDLASLQFSKRLARNTKRREVRRIQSFILAGRGARTRDLRRDRPAVEGK